MKRDLECASSNETAQGAARKMRDANVGFLPVCDESRRVLGAVTDRDLAVRVLADGKAESTKVTEVMTREVVACRPEDDIRKAEQLMGEHHKSRILCIDDKGALAGVISLSDIAQAEDDKRTARTIRQVTEREARA